MNIMRNSKFRMRYAVGLLLPVLALIAFGFSVRPNSRPTLLLESVKVSKPTAKYTIAQVTAIVQYNAPTLLKRYINKTPRLGTGPTSITDAKGRIQRISWSEGIVFRTRPGGDRPDNPVPAKDGALRFEFNWEIDTAQVPVSAGALTLHSRIYTEGKSVPVTAVVRDR